MRIEARTVLLDIMFVNINIDVERLIWITRHVRVLSLITVYFQTLTPYTNIPFDALSCAVPWGGGGDVVQPYV